MLLDRFACQGYLQAMADVLTAFDVRTSDEDEPVRVCLPDGVNGPDLAAVLKVYLLRNPKEQQKRPELVVTRALRDAFPCTP